MLSSNPDHDRIQAGQPQAVYQSVETGIPTICAVYCHTASNCLYRSASWRNSRPRCRSHLHTDLQL